MLTDLHVHLRRDDPNTPASEAFTTANADRYREVAEERGITELGVSEHIYRFNQSLRRLGPPVLARRGARRPR